MKALLSTLLLCCSVGCVTEGPPESESSVETWDQESRTLSTEIQAAEHETDAAATDTGLPSGMIVAYGGASAPLGWLACNGATVPRATFSTLYAAIGETWGQGDGVTTFQLPDLRGYFLRGADEQGLRDPDAGSRRDTANTLRSGVGSLQGWATAMPRAPFVAQPVGDHQHGDPTTNGLAGPYEVAVGSRGPSGFDYGAQSAPTTPAGAHGHALTGGDRESRPLNAAVLYIIKT